MKRQTILLALLPCLTFASERSLEQAASVARQFIAEQSVVHRAPSQAKVKCVYTQPMPNLEREAFYVFNTGDKGFVIVSAETNAPDVIGYSDENSFCTKNMPAHVQGWFDYYAQQLEWLAEHPTEKAFAPSKTYTPIEPLLGAMEWGQDEPFNYFCPIMPGEKARSVTGCVATAMSQIMAYHQWPKHSKGQHRLPYDTCVVLDYDKEGEYDWDNILPVNYKNTPTTPQQDTAVAKLMWHVGVAADMQYSFNGSGALNIDMARSLLRHFDYDSTIQYLYLNDFGAEALTDTLYRQFQLKQPCFLGGNTYLLEGHAFLCDGINEEGKLHINWGWHGLYNGYFCVSLLDPYWHEGGNVSEMAFTYYVNTYINIKPNEHNKPIPPTILADSLFYTGKSFTINRSDSFNVKVTALHMFDLWDFDGDVRFDLYQGDQFVCNLKSTYMYIVFDGYGYTWDENVLIPAGLPDGEYEICLGYKHTSSDKVEKAVMAKKGKIHLELIDGKILINGGVDLTVSNVQIQLEDYTAHLQWESLASSFRVQMSTDKRTYVDSIVSENKFTFRTDSIGEYTYAITPLDKNQQPSIWPALSDIVYVGKTCPITNLKCTGSDLSVTFTWESEAPKFLIEMKKGKKSIAKSVIDTPEVPFTSDKGTYTFFVTPLDESEKYTIGNTQTMGITLPFEGSDLLNLRSARVPRISKYIKGQQVIIHNEDKRYTILGVGE